MKLTGKRLALVAAVLVLSVSLILFFSDNLAKTESSIRVACLGDSITQLTEYPSDLQSLLGVNYEVGNFGVNASTVVFYTTRPYYYEPAFTEARSYSSDIAVIMLGTNDARENVQPYINNFIDNYEAIINQLQNDKIKPEIFLVKPPPIFNNQLGLNSTYLLEYVLPGIDRVADETGLPVIDVYSPLVIHPDYFPDGVHPNNVGAQIIANIIYDAIVQK